MTTPNLLPYWVSTNLQTFGPVAGPFVDLVNGTKTFTNALATDLTSTAAKAVSINTRLTSWYDAQTQPAAAAVQAFTDSVGSFVDGVWNSGINWYIIRPSYGGFSAITQDILPSLNNPSDPNAPHYSEDMYAGAVMLLLTGPPFVLFQAASILIMLSTGRTADALAALQALTSDSSAAGSVMTALSDLTSLPSTAWSTETKQLQAQFANSSIAKLLSGNVFPLNMLNAAAFAVNSIAPTSVKLATTTLFTLSGNGFLPSDVITINNIVYATTFIDAQTLTIAVDGADALLKTAGTKSVIITHKGATTTAGSIIVLPPTLFDELAQMSDPLYFNVWHSITAGNALNSLLPGAASFVDKAMQTLDTVGQAAVDAQSLGHTALTNTGALITAAATRATGDLTTIDNGASDFLAELLSLSASVLVIPPCQGGNHELGYALGQGLNGFALNTPIVNDADGVMAMFFSAGDTDRTVVAAAINQVAALLHISSWPTLV